MKCPICGKDVELQKKQVGTDENGEPVFNQYAVCRDCRKQWNLDKQRAKRAAAREHTDSTAPAGTKGGEKEEKQAQPAVKASKTSQPAVKNGASEPTVKTDAQKKRPVNTSAKKLPADAPVRKHPSDETERICRLRENAEHAPSRDGEKKPRRRPEDGAAAQKKQQENGAAAQKKRQEGQTAARRKRPEAENTAQRKRPENGTAARRRRPEDGVPQGKRPANAHPKKRPQADGPISDADTTEQKYGNIPSKQVRTKRETAVRKGYEDMLSTDPSYNARKKEKPVTKASQRHMNAYDDFHNEEDLEDEYIPAARFRVIRVIFGILSVVTFGYFAYCGLLAGLNSVSSGSNTSTGTTYIILALCMLVSGLLLLIMQKSNSVFAFLLPLAAYLGGSVFAFLKRSGDSKLLYFAIAGAVLTVIFLILTIVSRGGSDEDDYDPSEDYDDPFEDDFE